MTNSQPVEIVKQVNMFAVCADKQTGAVQHHVLLMTDDDPDPIHVDNSYATPTPLYADGRIYFSDKAGRTTIVAASPEFKILARKQLDGVIMVSPAAVDGGAVPPDRQSTLPDPTGPSDRVRGSAGRAPTTAPPRELVPLPSGPWGGR